MKELIHPNDPHKMNWVEGNKEWGTVKAPNDIKTEYTQEFVSETQIHEKYVFTNISNRDMFTSRTDIGIYTTFNDNYADAQTCLYNRCHTHIYCGGQTSYVLALRMGGEAPHLGMVLTNGSLCGYSVERDLSQISNDRGDFIMHPEPVHLHPNESFVIEWTLFFCDGKNDFYNKLSDYTDYIHADAKRYIIPQGDKIEVTFSPKFDFSEVSVTCNGVSVEYNIENGVVRVCESATIIGEREYEITVNNKSAKCVVSVILAFMELAKIRADFIMSNQQLHDSKSNLDGAFLIYDNEEEHMVCRAENDYNAGRERVGMGMFLTKYAQITGDAEVKKALKHYLEFVERELFDSETGMVYNNVGRDNSYRRIYNDSWFSRFFLESYKLFGEEKYLINSYNALMSFYNSGGTEFYPIMLPAYTLSEELKKAGQTDRLKKITEMFRKHAEYLLENGSNYPPLEVNFEQSIIAPATDCMMQYAQIFKEERYLESAKEHLSLLMLFNGSQPDYHLYQTAIRHWDGYWFAKNRIYGDTFPHYWSGLTGMALLKQSHISEDNNLLEKAYHCIMGTLTLIKNNGEGSCAYRYPLTVNGENARGFDPYANDQDWSLYFMLNWLENSGEIKKHK